MSEYVDDCNLPIQDRYVVARLCLVDSNVVVTVRADIGGNDHNTFLELYPSELISITVISKNDEILKGDIDPEDESAFLDLLTGRQIHGTVDDMSLKVIYMPCTAESLGIMCDLEVTA